MYVLCANLSVITTSLIVGIENEESTANLWSRFHTENDLPRVHTQLAR